MPIHLQDQVADEIKRLINNEYMERAIEKIEDCVVSPAVTTVEKNTSVKIALASRKLRGATKKRKV